MSDNTHDSERYQQAKKLFSELVDSNEETRAARLKTLESESPALAAEVRSLLAYHTSQSLVVPPASRKIRTRSTLATTYQTRSWSWLAGPARGLLVALPLWLAALGVFYWVNGRVQESLSASVTDYLNQTIAFRLSEFRDWEKRHLDQATSLSKHPDVITPIRELVEATKVHSADSPELLAELSQSQLHAKLGQALQRLFDCPTIKYAVWDRRMLTLADWNQVNSPEVLGNFVTPSGAAMLTSVLNGEPKIFFPKLGKMVTEGYQLEGKSAVLSIFVPIMDNQSGAVLAVLMVRGYGLEEKYQQLLNGWSTGTKDETYLLNNRGALLTRSRYGESIAKLGLAIDTQTPGKAVLVRDPGVNLLEQDRPRTESAAWPPTLLAQQVTSGISGYNVSGYRNYVGSRVVGVWRWLPDHQIGLALERDFDDAFMVSHLVKNASLGASALFSLGLLAMSIVAAVSSLSRKRLRDVSEVGPYQVQELLGEGGMGRVYLAEHALLCRQSAVKVLTKGNNDLSAIGRFEREVQLASQLTHPNTISIYDFGRNKDGLFYYAMEYVNGAHLGQLVEFQGPVEPGRCIFILHQLCRALLEAHEAGVVHRDIKPQNIMVCSRGGEPDFVKLFDYGLVKSFAPGVSHNSSQTKIVVGTPRFMAPERLNSPWLADPRVDVYSVGALAYFLLTAQLPPLVTTNDDSEHEQTGVETLDLPRSVVEFGELLSDCMAFEPSLRPSSMASLTRELDELGKKFPWSREDSARWWSKNEAKLLMLVASKRKKLAQT